MVGGEESGHKRGMPCAGVTQRYLDCGLHEVATGDKDSVADQKARVFIAELLVQCGADPDNRQHGCGGTPLHHTRASKSNVPRRGKELGLLALGRPAHSGGAPRPTAHCAATSSGSE